MGDWGPSVKIVIGGHIVGNQSWSTSFWNGVNVTAPPLTQAQLDGILGSINTALTAWLSVLKARWATDTQQDVQSAYYYASGATKSSVVSKVFPAVTGGSAASNILPSVVAMVQSLRTSTTGKSGRGRMYVPVTASALAGGHQFSAADCNSIGPATATFLTAVNALDWSSFGVPAHEVEIRSLRTGHGYKVVKVVADSIVDIQHRRSDKLVASTINSTTVV